MIAINSKIISAMPFIHKRKGETTNVIDSKSIIQALIIASVTSLIGMYVTQAIISQSLVTMKEDIQEIKILSRAEFKEVKSDISKIRSDFYRPMRKYGSK
jgi:hypothetical protein